MILSLALPNPAFALRSGLEEKVENEISTALLTVPALTKPPSSQAGLEERATTSPLRLSTKIRRVLIADDDEGIRRALERMLRVASEHTVEIEVVSSVAEGIRKFQEAMNARKPFDIAVTDLIFADDPLEGLGSLHLLAGETSALGLIKAINDSGSPVPILVLSGATITYLSNLQTLRNEKRIYGWLEKEHLSLGSQALIQALNAAIGEPQPSDLPVAALPQRFQPQLSLFDVTTPDVSVAAPPASQTGLEEGTPRFSIGDRIVLQGLTLPVYEVIEPLSGQPVDPGLVWVREVRSDNQDLRFQRGLPFTLPAAALASYDLAPPQAGLEEGDVHERYRALQADAQRRWQEILAHQSQRDESLSVGIVIPTFFGNFQDVQNALEAKLRGWHALLAEDQQGMATFHVYLVNDKPPKESDGVVLEQAVKAALDAVPGERITVQTLHLADALQAMEKSASIRNLASAADSVKWGSVRYGMERAVAEGNQVVVMMDTGTGEPDQDPLQLPNLLAPILLRGRQAVIGSRFMAGAAMMTVGIHNYLEFALFNPFVRACCPELAALWDVQSGYKAFSAEALRAVVPAMVTAKLAGDVEALWLIARRGGPEAIVEVPRSAELTDQPGPSSINPAGYVGFTEQVLKALTDHGAAPSDPAAAQELVEMIRTADLDIWRRQHQHLAEIVRSLQAGAITQADAIAAIRRAVSSAGLEESAAAFWFDRLWGMDVHSAAGLHNPDLKVDLVAIVTGPPEDVIPKGDEYVQELTPAQKAVVWWRLAEGLWVLGFRRKALEIFNERLDAIFAVTEGPLLQHFLGSLHFQWGLMALELWEEFKEPGLLKLAEQQFSDSEGHVRSSHIFWHDHVQYKATTLYLMNQWPAAREVIAPLRHQFYLGDMPAALGIITALDLIAFMDGGSSKEQVALVLERWEQIVPERYSAARPHVLAILKHLLAQSEVWSTKLHNAAVSDDWRTRLKQIQDRWDAVNPDASHDLERFKKLVEDLKEPGDGAAGLEERESQNRAVEEQIAAIEAQPQDVTLQTFQELVRAWGALTRFHWEDPTSYDVGLSLEVLGYARAAFLRDKLLRKDSPILPDVRQAAAADPEIQKAMQVLESAEPVGTGEIRGGILLTKPVDLIGTKDPKTEKPITVGPGAVLYYHSIRTEVEPQQFKGMLASSSWVRPNEQSRMPLTVSVLLKDVRSHGLRIIAAAGLEENEDEDLAPLLRRHLAELWQRLERNQSLIQLSDLEELRNLWANVLYSKAPHEAWVYDTSFFEALSNAKGVDDNVRRDAASLGVSQRFLRFVMTDALGQKVGRLWARPQDVTLDVLRKLVIEWGDLIAAAKKWPSELEGRSAQALELTRAAFLHFLLAEESELPFMVKRAANRDRIIQDAKNAVQKLEPLDEIKSGDLIFFPVSISGRTLQSPQVGALALCRTTPSATLSPVETEFWTLSWTQTRRTIDAAIRSPYYLNALEVLTYGYRLVPSAKPASAAGLEEGEQQFLCVGCGRDERENWTRWIESWSKGNDRRVKVVYVETLKEARQHLERMERQPYALFLRVKSRGGRGTPRYDSSLMAFINEIHPRHPTSPAVPLVVIGDIYRGALPGSQPDQKIAPILKKERSGQVVYYADYQSLEETNFASMLGFVTEAIDSAAGLEELERARAYGETAIRNLLRRMGYSFTGFRQPLAYLGQDLSVRVEGLPTTSSTPPISNIGQLLQLNEALLGCPTSYVTVNVAHLLQRENNRPMRLDARFTFHPKAPEGLTPDQSSKIKSAVDALLQDLITPREIAEQEFLGALGISDQELRSSLGPEASKRRSAKRLFSGLVKYPELRPYGDPLQELNFSRAAPYRTGVLTPFHSEIKTRRGNMYGVYAWIGPSDKVFVNFVTKEQWDQIPRKSPAGLEEAVAAWGQVSSSIMWDAGRAANRLLVIENPELAGEGVLAVQQGFTVAFNFDGQMADELEKFLALLKPQGPYAIGVAQVARFLQEYPRDSQILVTNRRQILALVGLEEYLPEPAAQALKMTRSYLDLSA